MIEPDKQTDIYVLQYYITRETSSNMESLGCECADKTICWVTNGITNGGLIVN